MGHSTFVFSNLTTHNIADLEGRRQALREAVRVLRAGGRLRIVDPPGAERYADVLRDAGCVEIAVQRLDWRTWFGVPGHHDILIAASKPPDPTSGHLARRTSRVVGHGDETAGVSAKRRRRRHDRLRRKRHIHLSQVDDR